MTPGTHPDRPFKIYVPLLTKSFGDILVTVKAAACVAAHFEYSFVTFHVHRHRPYVWDLVSLYPFWASIKTYDEPSELPPISAFTEDGIRSDPRSLLCQDLIVPATLAGPQVFWSYQDCPLAIRNQDRGRLRDTLTGLGLDPDRWFACIHYREPTYGFKQGRSLRDVDAGPYESVAGYIREELGGQVVRLGHPEMPVWPAAPGFVDLSRVPNPGCSNATRSAARGFLSARAPAVRQWPARSARRHFIPISSTFSPGSRVIWYSHRRSRPSMAGGCGKTLCSTQASCPSTTYRETSAMGRPTGFALIPPRSFRKPSIRSIGRRKGWKAGAKRRLRAGDARTSFSGRRARLTAPGSPPPQLHSPSRPAEAALAVATRQILPGYL